MTVILKIENTGAYPVKVQRITKDITDPTQPPAHVEEIGVINVGDTQSVTLWKECSIKIDEV
jgi:hypothetical protein